MLVNLEGRVALVTGGSQGLGKSTASRLAQSGGNVVLWARNASALEAAAQEIAESAPGRRVWPVSCDVTDPDQLEAAWRHTCENYADMSTSS